MMAAVFFSFLITMGCIFFKKYKPSMVFFFISFFLMMWMFKLHVTDKLNLNF